jgi:hypothetical protein
MTLSGRLVTYLSRLSNGKLVLWCYLVWYLSTVAHHFDPSPAIWLNSLGISAVIGVALMLSVSGGAARNDPWQAFRLFAMPFCVSSFSSLIKGKGFLLVFPPSSSELAAAIGACLLFAGTVMGWRRWRDAERA